MATLREYFDTDFSTLLKSGQEPGWQLNGLPGTLSVRVHFEFDANAKFVSVFFPVATRAVSTRLKQTGVGTSVAEFAELAAAAQAPVTRLRPQIEASHMAKPVQSAPQFVKYVGPVLDALQRLGGSGRPDEVRSVIAERLNLTEEQQSEPLPSKAQPRFDNQVHWARFYLSKGG
jgi:hypothetical protein